MGVRLVSIRLVAVITVSVPITVSVAIAADIAIVDVIIGATLSVGGLGTSTELALAEFDKVILLVAFYS
ncbi:hypothetical protein DFJ73DRAFT_777889 [Zopfochytrium polystomum]|nr:hypothetical protein DFJ73DRAFT_777889 [Zopfochytrium polystomum]